MKKLVLRQTLFFCLVSLFIHQQASTQSNFAHIAIDNIGPTVQSGRVTDIDVNPKDPTQFYVAYASGGLWYTANNGTTFEPLFDYQKVMTIGDIAVNWELGHIWIGTGEVNSSRSSYAGNGIYKSTNQGESWEYLGLPETHHIGRIILDTENPKTAIVAVLGHLYTDNIERGIFKTTDGGNQWNHTLSISTKTGIVDMVKDSKNSNILYAAAWQRSRKAWNFEESGEESAIYKSTDFGDSWTSLASKSNGFPTGDGIGRIGLDVTNLENGSRIYAFLDNYHRRPATAKKKSEGLTKDDFRKMDKAALMKMPDDKLSKYLKNNGFPKMYDAKKIKKLIKTDKIIPNDLAIYNEDANSLLFDTPVIGAEVYYSDDQGKTWNKTHQGYLDNVVYSYGYYFGTIRAYPNDPDKLVIMGVPILLSEDRGKNFHSINGENVHVDHHALWINPNKDGHMINGNDGGINISYDHGKNWIKCNAPSVGQFYYVNVDNSEPYNVYGGLQDNGVWKGSHKYQEGVRWHSTGKYPYEMIMGGDGMQVQIDPRDENVVYTGFQFGNYFRINVDGSDRKYITPKHKLGDRPYRWNWQSPILISPHNPDIIYLGSNKLLRSFNQGDAFDEISEDLTMGGKKGDVPYGTLASIDESVLKFGLIYTGSDDGKVWRTQDGGNSWTDLSAGLPEGLWVSRVQASRFDEGTVYLSLNAYRNDDFKSYIYSSSDYGETWNALGDNFEEGPVNVIKENPNDPNQIFVGTDHGCFVSLNKGRNFERFSENMPHVPVHDLVIQASANDLIIGTHGRSIYRADLEFLSEMETAKEKELYVFELQDVYHSKNWGAKQNPFRPRKKHDISFPIYSASAGMAKMKVLTENGKKLFEKSLEIKKGVSNLNYDLTVDAKNRKALKSNPTSADNGIYYLPVGTYKIELEKNGKKAQAELKLIERK